MEQNQVQNSKNPEKLENQDLFKDYQDPLSQSIIKESRERGLSDSETLDWLKAFV